MFDMSFSGSETLLGVGLLFALLFGGTLLLKFFYRKKSNQVDVNNPHAGEAAEYIGLGRTKYGEFDVFQHSATIRLIGLASTLLLVFLLFNWTQFKKEIIIPDDALVFDMDVEVESPRTAAPPPPPPPPPPPVIEAVPDAMILEDDQPEFIDQSIESAEAIDRPTPVADKPAEAAPPPPPPPPPPPVEEEEEVFKVVEEMPRFPGCENAGDKAEKKSCADKKLLEFIYEHIKYPSLARENGIEGTCVVSFVVDSKGVVKEGTILRDIGGGCGDEALRIIRLMNEKNIVWSPGKQRGRAVSVHFTLPVKFKLDV